MTGLHGPVVVRAAGLLARLRRPLALMRMFMVRQNGRGVKGGGLRVLAELGHPPTQIRTLG